MFFWGFFFSKNVIKSKILFVRCRAQKNYKWGTIHLKTEKVLCSFSIIYHYQPINVHNNVGVFMFSKLFCMILAFDIFPYSFFFVVFLVKNWKPFKFNKVYILPLYSSVQYHIPSIYQTTYTLLFFNFLSNRFNKTYFLLFFQICFESFFVCCCKNLLCTLKMCFHSHNKFIQTKCISL